MIFFILVIVLQAEFSVCSHYFFSKIEHAIFLFLDVTYIYLHFLSFVIIKLQSGHVIRRKYHK